jgi:hypothetical protein
MVGDGWGWGGSECLDYLLKTLKVILNYWSITRNFSTHFCNIWWIAAAVFPGSRQNVMKHCFILGIWQTPYTLRCYIASQTLLQGASQIRTDTALPKSLIYQSMEWKLCLWYWQTHKKISPGTLLPDLVLQVHSWRQQKIDEKIILKIKMISLCSN